MASAEAVQRRRANRASRRARKDPPRLVQQGCGGPMNIPMESHLWPEKQAVKRPFELSRAKFAYIEKRKESPWITRASAEAFWQCRTCGWEPWPVPVMFCGAPMQRNGEPVVDDATWEWFSSLHPKTRGTLVDLTRKINATERALQTKKPMPDISAGGVATRW